MPVGQYIRKPRGTYNKGNRSAIHVIGPSIAYIPLTRGQFSCVEVEDSEDMGRYNWTAHWADNTQSFYAIRGTTKTSNGVRGTTIFRMARQILQLFDSDLVAEHANRCTLDNRKNGNLRIATEVGNGQNHGIQKSNTSGLKGISEVRPGRWRARISVNGTQYHLGYFATKELAHAAYRAAAIKHHGEFARFE